MFEIDLPETDGAEVKKEVKKESDDKKSGQLFKVTVRLTQVIDTHQLDAYCRGEKQAAQVQGLLVCLVETSIALTFVLNLCCWFGTL